MSFFKSVWQHIVSFFQQDVVPTATEIEQAFLSQFATPGGQILFSAVTQFVVGLADPASIGGNILAYGATILKQFEGQELDLAGHDAANVVLDALRVHQSAAVASGTANASAPATVISASPIPNAVASGPAA